MNLDALAADIHRDAEILRTYRETGNVAATAREHGVTEYTVRCLVDPGQADGYRQRHKMMMAGPEWENCICEVGQTQQGRMYCAMCCDGLGCAEPATAERRADYERYNAARRRNNAKAAREERRISRRRTEEAVNMERRSIG